jgi:hypothetical protein
MAGKRKRQQQQHRQVLSEEEYVTTLENIVQRDYYPDTVSLEQHNMLLDCRANGDVAGAIAIRRQMAIEMRQQQQQQRRQQQQLLLLQQQQEDENNFIAITATIAGAGTDSLTLSKSQQRIPLTEETITGFHSRVTSDDNANFLHLQQKETMKQHEIEQQQQQQQLSIVGGGRSNVVSNSVVESPLPLASDQFLPLSHTTVTTTAVSRNVRDNNLFFVPPTYRKNNETTITTLISNEHNSDNSKVIEQGAISRDSDRMMMPPPAKRDTKYTSHHVPTNSSIPHRTSLQPAPVRNYIEPSATRFPMSLPIPFSSSSSLSLSSHLHFEDGDASSTATEDDVAYETDASATTTDIDAPAKVPLWKEQQQGRQYKQKLWNTLVEKSPTQISETRKGATTITTMPRRSIQRVTNNHSESTLFQMPLHNVRDAIAEQARIQIEARVRRARGNTSCTRSPDLSPLPSSASSLSTNIFKNTSSSHTPIVPPRSSSAFASALRDSYTPQPRRDRYGSPSLSIKHSVKYTGSVDQSTPRIPNLNHRLF